MPLLTATSAFELGRRCWSSEQCYNNNNNNNNDDDNNYDNVYGAIIMTKVIARVHRVYLMNAD